MFSWRSTHLNKKHATGLGRMKRHLSKQDEALHVRSNQQLGPIPTHCSTSNDCTIWSMASALLCSSSFSAAKRMFRLATRYGKRMGCVHEKSRAKPPFFQLRLQVSSMPDKTGLAHHLSSSLNHCCLAKSTTTRPSSMGTTPAAQSESSADSDCPNCDPHHERS